MLRYIGMYVSHCDLCLRTKIQHRLPSGELQPLPILEERWDAISMDFILELPESGGYDSIMVSVWKSGPRTGKRPGLDWTWTNQDRKSQDRKGPRPWSGPRSSAISKIPGLDKDWSGPVRTGLLVGKFIYILSITSHSNHHLSTPRPHLPCSKCEMEGLASFTTPYSGGRQEREGDKVRL